jgi:inhibitor of KinA sporulation pathway (predicted exonuclease)
MNDPDRYLNVVDVEATCWNGQPPAGMVNEIIEVGLTVVDLWDDRRVSKHSILVRPQGSTVSEFCTELTSLTQAQVDGGVTFAEACKMLAVDFAAGARRWASWGDYDRKQFEVQCQSTKTPYPFGRRHVNAKAVFAEAHGLRKRPRHELCPEHRRPTARGPAPPWRRRCLEHRRAGARPEDARTVARRD